LALPPRDVQRAAEKSNNLTLNSPPLIELLKTAAVILYCKCNAHPDLFTRLHVCQFQIYFAHSQLLPQYNPAAAALVHFILCSHTNARKRCRRSKERKKERKKERTNPRHALVMHIWRQNSKAANYNVGIDKYYIICKINASSCEQDMCFITRMWLITSTSSLCLKRRERRRWRRGITQSLSQKNGKIPHICRMKTCRGSNNSRRFSTVARGIHRFCQLAGLPNGQF
jgi:hypothetical protein